MHLCCASLCGCASSAAAATDAFGHGHRNALGIRPSQLGRSQAQQAAAGQPASRQATSASQQLRPDPIGPGVGPPTVRLLAAHLPCCLLKAWASVPASSKTSCARHPQGARAQAGPACGLRPPPVTREHGQHRAHMRGHQRGPAPGGASGLPAGLSQVRSACRCWQQCACPALRSRGKLLLVHAGLTALPALQAEARRA